MPQVNPRSFTHFPDLHEDIPTPATDLDPTALEALRAQVRNQFLFRGTSSRIAKDYGLTPIEAHAVTSNWNAMLNLEEVSTRASRVESLERFHQLFLPNPDETQQAAATRCLVQAREAYEARWQAGADNAAQTLSERTVTALDQIRAQALKKELPLPSWVDTLETRFTPEKPDYFLESANPTRLLKATNRFSAIRDSRSPFSTFIKDLLKTAINRDRRSPEHSPVPAATGSGRSRSLRSSFMSLQKEPGLVPLTHEGPVAVMTAESPFDIVTRATHRLTGSVHETWQGILTEEATLTAETHPMGISAGVFARDMVLGGIGAWVGFNLAPFFGVTNRDDQARWAQTGMGIGGLLSLGTSITSMLNGGASLGLGLKLLLSNGIRMGLVMAPVSMLVDEGLKYAGVQDPTTRLAASVIVGGAASFALTRYFGVLKWGWKSSGAFSAIAGFATYTMHVRTSNA